jgi:hypothetical protein
MYRPGGHAGLVHAGGRNNTGPAVPDLHHRLPQWPGNGQPFGGGKGKHPAPPPAPDLRAGLPAPPVGGDKGKESQRQNKRENGQIKGLYRAARHFSRVPHIILSHEKTEKYTGCNLQAASVFSLLLKECSNTILNAAEPLLISLGAFFPGRYRRSSSR